MKSKSRKMQRIDAKYKKLRLGYLNDYPMCNAALPGCTNKSTDIHHKKGRGKYHNDITTWLSVCRTCHNWIELNPIEAEELGFSLKRI